MKNITFLSIIAWLLTGCGGAVVNHGNSGDLSDPTSGNQGEPTLPIGAMEPVGTLLVGGKMMIQGRAMISVNLNKNETSGIMKEVTPEAIGMNGNVTYTNAASTTFTVDTSGLTPKVAATSTGNTLNLGKIVISALSDNNLSVCGNNGKSACSNAIIRAYTTGGSVAGFVNISDGTYGSPVFIGTDTTSVGLGSQGALTIQQIPISKTTHRITLSNVSVTNFAVTSDFSNAGAGSYSMTLVVEYILVS